ncbi:MAG TPA: DtxR family transcriptional regulator [Clostridiales bacterium]|nr:DtxR family transcriptional regulator [Clostridiales bacterium]
MATSQFHTVRGYQMLEQNKDQLTPAMEDYLEMIYRNIGKVGFIRINRLAQLLNVKASSATKMVQKLGQMGLLRYERYGIITLTESGMKMGEFLLERHNIIESFLKKIGSNKDILKEAELIEHNISTDTLNNIKILLDFFEHKPEISRQFDEYRNKRSSTYLPVNFKFR